MKHKEWKEKAAEVSGVPKDVAMGLPILTITGTCDICVENYRGMTEYTDQLIRLQSRCGQIRIQGKGLEVIYYTNDEMMIHGQIKTIEYQK
ncbi:MAG: YabP/YqfC family sporulation protein [Dorea sp.]|nr:YabP/YqfC family sporulation protein [uncultured Dorea sp.]